MKIPSFLRRVTPLRIALVIALAFCAMHFAIELSLFSTGPLSRSGFIRLLDLKSLDLKFLSRGKPDNIVPKVVVAAVDEKSIERYGLFPWNRRIIGDLVDKLTEGGAKVIGFDIVFGDEDRNSSYQSVRRFLTAYDERALSPSSKLSKEMLDELRTSGAAQVELKNAIAELENKLKDREGKQPPPPGSLVTLQRLKAQNEKSLKNLGRARELAVDWNDRSGKFYEMMSREISDVSPDEALARAVGRSPQTILGYFFLRSKEELKSLSMEAMKEAAIPLKRAAIPSLYIEKEAPYGVVIEPTESDWPKMHVDRALGVRAVLPKIAEQAKGFGNFNVSPDQDGVARKAPLLAAFEGAFYPALSLASAAKYLDQTIYPIEGLWPKVTIDHVDLGEMKIPTTERGEMLIDYYGVPQQYIPTISVADILDGSAGPESFKDKVVLVGMTAIGTYDFRVTPFSPVTPGVYIHAAGVQNILDGRFLVRQDYIVMFEMIAFLLLGVLMGVGFARLPAWATITGTLLFGVVVYFIDVWAIFSNGFWTLNVLPTMQATLTAVAIIIYKFLTEGREKRQIRKAFQHYLNKTVVDMIIKDPSRLKLGGERRECTVFFSDVRGFTTLSEKLSPEQLVHVLNTYLTPMTDLIFKYDGTLDKYIGDAIMAFFNAPIDQSDHAIRACHVSVDMMVELERLRKEWAAEGMTHHIDIGIGLNSGPMVVGNMGTPNYFNYTAMGDTVNLGSRLEGINKEYGTNIIISQSTHMLAKEHIHVREMDLVKVKGKNDPVHIYELVGKGAATGASKDLLDAWGRGLNLYRNQKWDDAIAIFDMIRTQMKIGDGPSETYIERCEIMRAEPPGANWDGVWTMTTK
ncbi:MAG: CHASE2 domain-containing protein [Myxococcota bacterium]